MGYVAGRYLIEDSNLVTIHKGLALKLGIKWYSENHDES